MLDTFESINKILILNKTRSEVATDKKLDKKLKKDQKKSKIKKKLRTLWVRRKKKKLN